MRICIIGNSHVACLREAWAGLIGVHAGVRMRFFASRGNRLETLDLRDGVFRSSDPSVSSDLTHTSGGLDHIPLADFDVFLVHGGLQAPRLPDYVSSAVVQQCCGDSVDQAMNTQLARLIFETTKRPVFSGHVPMRANNKIGHDVIPYPRIHEAMRARMESFGIGLLRQPEETVAGNFGTHAEFAQGAPRLAAGSPLQQRRQYPDDNMAHMNAAFGRIFLNRFLTHALAAAAKS